MSSATAGSGSRSPLLPGIGRSAPQRLEAPPRRAGVVDGVPGVAVAEAVLDVSRKRAGLKGEISQMSRIQPPTVHAAPEETRPILATILEEQGYVPHVYRLMAISPPLMVGWTGLQSALQTTFDAQMRNAIALAVSHVSACKYCISGHSYMSERFTRQCARDADLQRRSEADSGRRAAAAKFASALVSAQGKVGDGDLDEIRSAGFSDREILEIVALSAQFLLTNMLAGVAELDIDVPHGDYGWMA